MVLGPLLLSWCGRKMAAGGFCVDYRKFNADMHKDAFALLRIEETLTCLTKMKWFFTLDLASGYWQVEMDCKDSEKKCFYYPIRRIQL